MMNARYLTSIFFALMLSIPVLAQDKTTVRANSSDISDNLDLRAVATIFGDSRDLEDFERRLNDPKSQISNLDLNNDNYVDYLRVIEVVEGNAHIIVIQAVLGKDLFQDVASIEVEKDRNNNVTVQVVGDVYMYGTNYIYEPVYVHRPIIYTTFWAPMYRPYYSSWYWGYYPSYYSFWNPFPIFRYRNHIALHINFGHSFHYVNHRRCHYAYNSYYGRRGNAYERMHPNRSFTNRNSGYSNRRELDNNRDIRTRVPGSRELASNNGNSPRNNGNNPRNNGVTTSNPRNSVNGNSGVNPRSNSSATGNPRSYSQNSPTPRATSSGTTVNPRNNSNTTGNPRTYSQNSPTPRNNNSGTNVNPRNNSNPRTTAVTSNSPTRNNVTPRNSATNSPRSTVNSGGNSRNSSMSAPSRASTPRQSGNSGGSRGNSSNRNGRS
jgi:hypothetical protein